MKVNETKLARQLEALEKWSKVGKGIGRMIQPTGFGKTYEQLILVQKLHTAHPGFNILYIAANEAGRANIYNSLTALSHVFDGIIRARLFIHTKGQIISNTIPMLKHYNAVIIDEIHEFVSDKAYDILKKIYFDYTFIAGFTGSDVAGKDKEKLDRIAPIIDYISYEEAIENKWISDFCEYNFGLTLSKEEMELYTTYSEYIGDSLKLTSNDYDLLIALAKGRYDKITKSFTKYEVFCEALSIKLGWTRDLDLSNPYYANVDRLYSPSNLHERALMFQKYVDLRNALLDTSLIKINAILSVAQLFKSKKMMIFNNNITVVDVLHKLLNFNISDVRKYRTFSTLKSFMQADYIMSDSDIAVKYHSLLEKEPMFDNTTKSFIKTKSGDVKLFGKTAQQSRAIERIQSGASNILLAVKGLDSALNVEDLEVSIISGGSTNPLQQVQRKGRPLRISEYKSLAYIINIYFKGTRDEFKLKQRQSSTTNEIIEITSLEQIII